MSLPASVRVAVVQDAPVLFDRDATIARAAERIAEAARAGARLVVLPEAFVPAYPRGLDFGTVVGSRSDAGRALFARYWAQAVDVPGPAVEALGAAARAADAWVAVGVVERADTGSGGTLFCTTLYLAPDGSLAGRHRKLRPTGAERVVWGDGDLPLPVIATPFGRVGGLICWEHYMPLARAALYAQGVDLWVAPTADARESWQATVRHVACEGRCFVLSANQCVAHADYPADLRAAIAGQPDPICRGGSVIVSPMGDVLAGPLWDRAGLLVADLDLGLLPRARFDLDVTGHYARPDRFTLVVHPTTHPR